MLRAGIRIAACPHMRCTKHCLLRLIVKDFHVEGFAVSLLIYRSFVNPRCCLSQSAHVLCCRDGPGIAGSPTDRDVQQATATIGEGDNSVFLNPGAGRVVPGSILCFLVVYTQVIRIGGLESTIDRSGVRFCHSMSWSDKQPIFSDA